MRSSLARAGFPVLCALLLAVAAPRATALAQQEASGALAALESAEDASRRVHLEGTVLLPDGGPARGAVVVTSAGGSAAVRADGSFALDVAVTPDVEAVLVSAVANGSTGSLIAHRRVDGLSGASARDAGVLLLSASAGCAPEWLPTFGGQPGTSHGVACAAVYDDGSGPALYVGGAFTSAGGVPAARVARWDGEAWSKVGGGVNGGVEAMTVLDDGSGSGPALCVAGSFTSAGGKPAKSVARWNGKAWSALGSGVDQFVYTLVGFDDGTGPALYAGGSFTTAGGAPASGIAKWDGQGWSEVGGGVNGSVRTLAVIDDGSGPALYAGGQFGQAGGVPAPYVARWNGQAWSGFGSGPSAWAVNALAWLDDGSGSGGSLYAGGEDFTGTNSGLVRWDGTAWTPVEGGPEGDVHSLVVLDDGSGNGPALYAGGNFESVGDQPAESVAKWDGSSWSALGEGIEPFVKSLVAFDDGSGDGPALFATGVFERAGDVLVRHVAKWNGEDWVAVGDGLDAAVRALAVFDGGQGPELIAAGRFGAAGGQGASRIAKWNGEVWTPLGSGMDGNGNQAVAALAVFDDGSGPALYAGGFFSAAGGHPASNVARWDGQAWSAVGSGTSSSVLALAVFDDGSGGGPALYAGGTFHFAGGLGVGRIARWDGQAWSALGAGMDGDVLALHAVHEGPLAPALFAGGSFEAAGGQPASRIARWDGQAWSPLGGGVSGDVLTLAGFDDGSGAGVALYAGGEFGSAGGSGSIDYVARWDGQAWSALGGGVNLWVMSLFAVDADAPGGPALYAGGVFDQADGMQANGIARWDGAQWTPLSSGMTPSVGALQVYDDGSGAGPALFAAGDFVTSEAKDAHVAKWGCPVIRTLPGCFGNPAVLTALSSEAEIGGGFEVSLSSSQHATGLGLLLLGFDKTDAGGCGILVPGVGELLLGVTPVPPLIASGALSAGKVELALSVPPNPAIVGIDVALSGAIASASIELSNGLVVTLTQ